MESAIELARKFPPNVLGGDALDLVGYVLADIPRDTALCVFHTHTLNQFSQEMRGRFASILKTEAQRRRIFWLSSEGIGRNDATFLELAVIEQDSVEVQLLGYAQPHGRWIEWVDRPQETNWVMRNS